MIHDALDRELYEGSTDPANRGLGGGRRRSPGTLNEDQQNLVAGTGESYWLFMNAFGRDSYDGAGATMKTVNNDPRIACPNANWNGVTTNYCNGVTSDDVVAHEWGHAYTEFTWDGIYQWQPGALNESYSDIWGETVDLINGRQDEDEGDIDRRATGRPVLAVHPRPRSRWSSTRPAGDRQDRARGRPGRVRAGLHADRCHRRRRRRRRPGRPGRTEHDRRLHAVHQRRGRGRQLRLVDRGTCAFQVKVDNAEAAGAIGIVVGDNVARPPADLDGRRRADIYGRRWITLEDGALIKTAPTGTGQRRP